MRLTGRDCMKPFTSHESLYREVAQGRTESLAYWIGQNRRTGAYLFQGKLKVSGGIRHLVSGAPRRPSVNAISRQCLEVGAFSPRPYQLAQVDDGSTRRCALAL